MTNADLFAFHEGDTQLTPEEQLEIIPGLTTRVQLNEVERLNINEARQWAMRRSVLARNDLVSDTFGRELHRRMFDQVWRWAGQYRKTERNLGWDVHRITEATRNVFEDALAQLGHRSYFLDEIAVRLHHQLVVIHPWPNGNGRHSRLIADVIVASRGGEPLTWGANADLVGSGEIRARYLDSVRAADNNDYGPMLAFARS